MKKSEKIKQSIAESIQIPKDIMLKAPIVTSVGDYDIYIENYSALLECDENNINIKAKNCVISIKGKNLIIEYFTYEEMKVIGDIEEIKYIK